MKRTAERVEFLSSVLVGAIENYGYGWFSVINYDTDAWTAKIKDSYTEIEYDVDLDTIAKGIGVIRNAVVTEVPDWRGDAVERVLANGNSGQRLYLGVESRKAIIQASRDNDAGELDMIDCLTILECAIFGAVKYA